MNKQIIKEFHKRFANGEQFIHLDGRNEIVEETKTFFWQVNEVYNRILPAIHRLKSKYPYITEKDIYGEKGLVAALVPIQRAYNAVKNRKLEYLNRLTAGTLMVEDGSVDTNNIEEEGLTPGKILVYRQGSYKPEFLEGNKLNLDFFDLEEERLLADFNNIISGFECFIKYKKEKNKRNGN